MVTRRSKTVATASVCRSAQISTGPIISPTTTPSRDGSERCFCETHITVVYCRLLPPTEVDHKRSLR